MRIVQAIDAFLNRITMYRAVLYGLGILVITSFLLSFAGYLPYTIVSLSISFVVLLVLCLGFNYFFAKLFHVPTNVESAAISALILFFLLTPLDTLETAQWYLFACFFAMASKYLLAVHKKHVFNPVAFGVFAVGFLGSGDVIWWVGNTAMFPLVLVVGLLIVRKIRRFHLFFSFVLSSTFLYLIQSIFSRAPLAESLWLFFVSFPVIFFGTVMLTEPLTTPPKRNLQMIYGLLVGVLFCLQFHIGRFYSTPELALLIGNIFSYLVSSKEKLVLTLTEKREIAHSLYEFIFRPNTPFSFEPGQYLEWTLPPNKSDSRGNRRYFTIASSPLEKQVKIGIHFEEAKYSSTFKRTLLHMRKGDTVLASQLAGDFVMPEAHTKKLTFIAGGIGVTPFRSMIAYLMDTKQKRDIVLIYSASHPNEFAYTDLFRRAEKEIGLRVMYMVTNKNAVKQSWTGYVGRLSGEIVKKEVPDYLERKFYLSGPNKMVENYKALLQNLGVSLTDMVTDYFPGF